MIAQAEKMVDLLGQLLAEQKKTNELLAKMGAAAPRASAPAAGGGAVFPGYGKSAKQPIAGASMRDLEFYANGCVRSLSDPAKAKWHDNERKTLDAINAEIARQGGQPIVPAGDTSDFGPPPGFDAPPSSRPTEDDIPF